MKAHRLSLVVIVVLVFSVSLGSVPARAACRDAPVALQILGSGGPVADDARAASGYLVWTEGRARVLIDVGGGTFLRFGEAGARIEDLDLVAITHLHTDHVTDLPALLKGGFFSARKRPLGLSGPRGNLRFPSLSEYLHGSFDPKTGTYRYLSGFLDGSDGLFALDTIESDAESSDPVEVMRSRGLVVQTVGVHHGPVPTLGYLIETAGRRIAISGDQNLSTRHFLELAKGADLLVMPFAIPEDAGPVARTLHAAPSAIGRAARDVDPDKLVLSHFMARSLVDLEDNLAAVREHYRGALVLADDLMCIPIP